MAFQDLPIKRKVVAVVMSTTLIALVLAITAFVVHDLVNFRRNLIRTVSTTAAIVAENSSSSVAFFSESDAHLVLEALHSDPHLIRAAIYNEAGDVYVSYPTNAPITDFPLKPGPIGPHVEEGRVVVFAPIFQHEKRLGTLYLVSDLRALSDRLRLFSFISVVVLLGALVVALAISNKLQRSITAPVLALAGTARMVSERGDYSVRAQQVSGDEFGLLTDAFNLMLGRIQEQTVALRENEMQLRLAMEASRIGTFDYHIRNQRIVLDHYLRSLLGVPEEAHSERFADFLALIHPDDREQVAQAIQTAIDTRSEYNAEYRVVTRDNQTIHITSRGRASYDESGQPMRMNGVALDVSIRKKAEETQSVLAAIVESSDDAIVGTDLDGHILSWNRGAERMLGYTAGEMIGKTIDKIIPPGFLKIENAAVEEVKKGAPRHFESGRTRKDGTLLNVSVSLSPIKNARDQIGGIASIVRDITETIRGQDAQRRLAAIVESSDDAIISSDLRGTIASWNQGATKLYGYTQEEVIGKHLTIIVPADRPDEEPAILDRLARGETIDHYETLRRRKDGTLVEVSLTVSPLRNAQGVVIGASKFARDITEVKQAQAALERQANVLREQAQMLDLANVLARDLDDRIILWNSGMEKLYGWTKVEALGKVTHQLFRTIFPQPRSLLQTRLMEEGRWEGELVHFRKDGSRINVSSQWVVHRDNNGKAAAILEVNTDITDRKRAEAEITRINAELEQRVEVRTAELTAANKELEAFTYSVAHDLRAPLRHIDAFSRILHEDYAGILPPEAQHYLHNIRHGSRNMSRLVDDLLNLARVGRQELKRRTTPLPVLLQDVISDLKTETDGRNIDWKVQPLPTVECDAGLMKQVFANLLSNAVKYTRPRQVAVIEVGASETESETVIFVRDNGVGFSMKYADKLFGVFQRLHRAEEFEGTGVGLATVERIVRKHGGRIWAEAAVDKGATFTFSISKLKPAAA